MAARPPPPPQKAAPNQAANAGAPNQTLYVRNLNDKINREDLKRSLYMLFSTYGPVLDIITCRRSGKGKQMRGQAHVCFRDVQTSIQAMRALQKFEIFGKEMEITYARGTSDIIPKLRGTFEPPTAPTATTTESTDLQKSIFNAPPSGIPAKPVTNGLTPAAEGGPHGTKRTREEVEEEEDEDVAMEEDEDDAPMEEDDDD